MLDSIDLNDDNENSPMIGRREPPPVQPSQGAPVRRDTQPSVSVEQAAKPSFHITVGDPHKVGDLTSSHIVYLVTTKVDSLSSEHGRKYRTDNGRRVRKHIASRNSLSREDIEISYGFTIVYMAIIRAWLSHRRRRSRLLDALIRILSSRGERRWRGC
jgi:hypothetical protein